MRHLAFWTLIRTWKRSLLFMMTMSVFIAAATALLNSVNMLQTEVGSHIEKHGRGSYDILVRPAHSQNVVEKSLGLVEDNYISSGDGGISIEQWEKIKALPMIDAAAPVASIGYFTGVSSSVTLKLPHNESGRIDIQFTTSDGLQDYMAEKPITAFKINNETQFGLYESVGKWDLLRDVHLDHHTYEPIVLIPQTYHHVVAIDTDQEKALTGLNFEEINRPLSETEKMELAFAGNAPVIPVLALKDPIIPLGVKWGYASYSFSEEQLNQWRSRMNIKTGEPLGFGNDESLVSEMVDTFLDEIKRTDPLPYFADLSSIVMPFSSTASVVSPSGETEPAINWTASQSNTSAYYSIGKPSYEIHKEKVSVKQQGVNQAGVPEYRSIERKGVTSFEQSELPFVLHPIDTFSTAEQTIQLAASPLGIYSQLPTYAEDGRKLTETMFPGSFIQAPAHGLIRLSDAALVKDGPPIDAIRIRVAGKGGYTKELVRTVEEGVLAISKIGDFQIDVVAGASPQELSINVEGMGLVKQPWTTLGASAKIAEGWNLVHLGISILFFFIGVVFLRSRMLFWQLENAPRDALLENIGWRRRDIRRFSAWERNILLLLTILLSGTAVLTFITGDWLDHNAWYIFAGTAFAAIMLTILFARGKNELSAKQISYDTQSIAIKNVVFYRKHILLSALQLSLVSLLTTFVAGSMFVNRAATSVTFLGSFIDQQIGPLLLVTLLAAIMFAVMTTIDGQEALRQTRMKTLEMLRAIGWRNTTIRVLWLKETLIWVFPALLSGLLIGGVSVTLVFQWSLAILVLSLIIFISLFSLVLMTVLLGLRKI
ncbi:MAG TPA: hypothetical protein VIG80_08950 [Bacillaceae bacterium]